MQFDHWLTRSEVAQILGTSEKTVNRLTAEGKLRKAYREVAGRKPLPVWDPASVEAEKASRQSGEQLLERAEGADQVNQRERALGGPAVAQLVGALMEQRAHPPAIDPGMAQALQAIADSQLRMAELFSQALQAIAQPRALLPPPAEPEKKLALTMSEAAALTGLDVKELKRRIQQKKLRNFGNRLNPRIPRADLEAMFMTA